MNRYPSLPHTLLILVLITAQPLFAQQTAPLNKYLVLFTDKDLSLHSIYRPWEFLSARALERRAKFGIAIDASDIPVSVEYLRDLESFGVAVHTRSRWLNGAQVVSTDSIAEQLKTLPFVREVHYVGRHRQTGHTEPATALKKGKTDMYDSHFGLGGLQIGITNGHVLHQLGFRGEGVLVQVQDGGFSGVHLLAVFDSLRSGGRLVPGFDYIETDREVFESSAHGSQVLSVMGANMPGVLVGTAPDATYVLCKTEDTKSESRIEEINWIAGAEYADSIGADIINSSLGYTSFNDKTLNWSYADMDGQTTWVTRGAEMAHRKGMIVVNSAGNEGNSEWRYIGSPADGASVLSVGATTWEGDRASFSSIGPSADGRVKPNVAAPGNGVVVTSAEANELTLSAGTSFSAPLVAGLVSTLWQAFPDRSNEEIVRTLESTASQAEQPDSLLGYGIPDMAAAFLALNDRYVILADDMPVTITDFRKPVAILPAGTFPDGASIQLFGARGELLDTRHSPAPSEHKGLHVQLHPGHVPPPYAIVAIRLP